MPPAGRPQRSSSSGWQSNASSQPPRPPASALYDLLEEFEDKKAEGAATTRLLRTVGCVERQRQRTSQTWHLE
jgi:hypothetical protein